MCFFNTAEESYLEQREPISTFKNLSCRKYSFLKLTRFSQGNTVLFAEASNIHGSLWRDASVSSTLLNRPIWNVVSLSS
jgi:hypothetical protein